MTDIAPDKKSAAVELPEGAAQADHGGESQPESESNARYFRTDHLIADLKGRSVRGGIVTLSAQGLKFALQMGSTMALARLLTPADFGLVAMVVAVTGFVAMFKDAGLSMATIQRDRITHGQVSNLFWINVAISLVLMIVTAGLAPAIAGFYGEPKLTLITFAIAGTFIFSGLTVQHQALLRRQMQFKKLAMIEIASMAVGVTAAVIVGFITRSYWALVMLPAGIAIANAVGVWIACGWIPGRPRRGTDVVPMLKFGGNLTAFSVINYFTRNGDNILIGWWAGAAALGFYTRAYGLLLLPINQMNSPVSSVILPALSRLQNDAAAFKALYCKAVEGIAWLGMPAITLLALHASAVIDQVLGDQWQPAALVFQLLAPAALMAVTNVATSWAVLPQGRADKQLKLALVTSPLFLIAIVAGLPYGIEGVAIAVSASRLALKLPTLAYCYAGTELRVRDFITSIAGPAALCLTLVLIHFALLQALPRLGVAHVGLISFATQLLLAGTALVKMAHSRRLLELLRKRKAPQ